MPFIPPPDIKTDPQEKKTETIKHPIIKSITENVIHYTFYITFVFLTTTATITFIEAIRTNDSYIRHIMNLETCISFIASFFYYIFITKIDESLKNGTPIEWKEFSLLRYTDWSITTPFMLLSLLLFLGYNVKVPVTISMVGTVWLLNYIMLLLGFLGEIGQLTKWTACLAGFVPLFLILSIIYMKFIHPKFNLSNAILFGSYVILWILYGIAYLLSEEYKNISMNILDLFSKCFVGIGMWMYFIHVIRGS